MLTYETIFIASPDVTPAGIDELTDKIKNIITKPGGEIVSVDKWGRRRLAYPIRRQREGFYVLVTFKAPSQVMADMTRFYGVSEGVLRHIICHQPRSKPMSEKPVVAPVAGAAAPEAAAAAPAATPDAAPKETPHA